MQSRQSSSYAAADLPTPAAACYKSHGFDTVDVLNGLLGKSSMTLAVYSGKWRTTVYLLLRVMCCTTTCLGEGWFDTSLTAANAVPAEAEKCLRLQAEPIHSSGHGPRDFCACGGTAGVDGGVAASPERRHRPIH